MKIQMPQNPLDDLLFAVSAIVFGAFCGVAYTGICCGFSTNPMPAAAVGAITGLSVACVAWISGAE